jgi:hypothetical protein
MAGQPQRGSRGRGRSPRRASSAPLGALPSGAGRGHASTATPTTTPSATPTREAVAAADQLITRSTYRLLLTKGLTPDEAATLTAFLCGIPIAEVHWSLRQVNQLLFLREMARTGRFGPRDGEPARPH